MPKVVMGRLLDPLGNQWLEPTAFISDVALAISRRVQTLLTYTRVPSRQLGPAEPVPQSPKLAEFMCWVKAISIQLHELMHGANQDRFLGNYAFRCLNGFPAYSNGEGKVYVSPRNVDKRGITTSDLIHVHTVIEEHPCFNLYVGYYGERKPSVDAPIQLGLFARFPYIKYMLHTHVYIEGAQTTNTIIPCGALEEVDYFNNRFPDSTSYLAVNLRGHGSIVMMDDTSLSELQRIKYVARPMPENAAPWI